jgi:D-psicose/D-tagatose/L-ribulose 3-epimerase
MQGESRMKYGINTMVWTTRVDESQAALFSRIREWGFDGAELFVSPQEPVDIPAVRKMLEKNQLECTTSTAIPRECHLVSPQPEVRGRGVEFLKTCVDRTAELGARLICGPMFAGLGVMTGRRRTPEDWNWAVEGLQVVAHHAQKRQVMVCLEPVNRFETYCLNTLEDTARLIHDIGEPNVKILFDTFHANIEERHPAEALRSVAAELGHVHASENDRGIPGTGHIDWQGVLKALKVIRYNGWMTIESFAQPEPDLAAAAAVWRDIAPSGDELAQQGLRFIRTLARGLGVK